MAVEKIALRGNERHAAPDSQTIASPDQIP